LKKLAISSAGFLARGPLREDVGQFVEALPALEELHLEMGYQSGDLKLPWSRLRRCAVDRCEAEDLLRILPLLSPGAHLSCTMGGTNGTLPSISVESVQSSPIRALELHECHEFFVGMVLDSLTAPLLEELTITPYNVYHSKLAAPIRSFLSRSACALTLLCLRVPLPEDDLLAILNSPCARGITHLEFGTLTSSRCIDALTTADLVAGLRALAFGSHPTFIEQASVLALAASRRPVLRELRVQSRKSRPVLSQDAVDVLGTEGMELMLSEYDV